MNAPEKLFHTLLGLGDDWEITELEFDKDSGQVRLRIIERPSLLSHQHCPDDSGEVCIYDHGRKKGQSSDLSISGRRVKVPAHTL